MRYVIRRFEGTSSEYASLAALLTAVWPEQPASSSWLERSDGERDAQHPVHRETAMAADDPDCWVGTAEARPHRWPTRPGLYELQVAVHPDHRRRGVGAALYDRAAAAVRAHAWALESGTREDRHDAVQFLTRRGFRKLDRNPESMLDLAAFDPSQWAEAVDRAESTGVRLRTLTEVLTNGDDMLRAIWELETRTECDAPGQRDREPAPFDRWRRAFDDNPDLLPQAYIVAVDGDRLVGLSHLWASQATDSILYTGFTGVLPSYRRRGLATAMKVRSLAWARGLETTAGGPPLVRTGNEETNPMLAINLALGFRERPAWLRFGREVGPDER